MHSCSLQIILKAQSFTAQIALVYFKEGKLLLKMIFQYLLRELYNNGFLLGLTQRFTPPTRTLNYFAGGYDILNSLLGVDRRWGEFPRHKLTRAEPLELVGPAFDADWLGKFRAHRKTGLTGLLCQHILV